MPHPVTALPRQIGRYRVLSPLGQGAMGVVYRGRDETLDREVALKVMALGPGADAEARARFQREARAVARLQHPNIVTVYELGEHEGAPYMAMELLEGVDLQRAIEAGLRPNPRATLPIVLQLLSGLGHAHENGIVHRDVKPSNLFLPRGRPAKIMDFGVARLAGGMTTTGQVVGTPNYMSPEQVRGAHVDGRSDLFSAGLILYELVTGEKAYRGDSVVSLLFKIAHEQPDLSLIPKGTEWDRLRAILARALAKDPSQRYPHAPAMAAVLSQALVELGGSLDGGAASDRGLMVRTPRPSPAPAFEPAGEAPATPAGDEPSNARLLASPIEAPVGPIAAAHPEPAHAAMPVWIPVVVMAAASALVLAAVGLLLSRRGSPSSPSVASTAPSPAVLRASGPTPPALPSTPAASSAPVPSASAPAPRDRAAAAPPASIPSPASAPDRPAMASLPAAPAPEANRAAPPAEPGGEDQTVPPGPEPGDARLERANELLAEGHFGAALAEARAVLRREPGNAEARELAEDAEVEIVVERRLREARAALERGDTEAALEAAKAGLAVKPTDARLLAVWREATR